MNKASACAAAAAMLAAAGSARAEDRPALFPTRDVDIVYRMVQADGPGGPRVLEQRMRYGVAARKLRVDPPSPGLHMIVDYATRRLETIRDDQRMVMELDAPGSQVGDMLRGPSAVSSTAFQRRGAGQVAGLNCTEWETRDATGQPALVCLTDDGVMLRAVGGGRVLLEAAHVVYGPIDPGAFIVPTGYTHLTPPPLASARPAPVSPGGPAKP